MCYVELRACMSGMERRTFHSEQLSGLLLPHKVHLPNITSSQHFDLVEAAGTYLHLHKQTNRCIKGGYAEELNERRRTDLTFIE